MRCSKQWDLLRVEHAEHDECFGVLFKGVGGRASTRLGKTAVATRTPALGQYLLSGVDCLVVPARNPSALRSGIEAAAADAGVRRRIGVEARRSAAAGFSAKKMWAIGAADLHARTPSIL